ncbi:hypothetical protein P3W45_001830, partial [Vairimorpha bombi]
MLINPNAVNIKFFILEDRHQSYNTIELNIDKDPPQEEALAPKAVNYEASLDAIMQNVEASKRDWPRKAYRVRGWTKTFSFYCEKFNTKITDTLFKKKAKETLLDESGRPTRVREFNEEEYAKRTKILEDILEAESLKETATRGKISKIFNEEKISSLKIDLKAMESLNDSQPRKRKKISEWKENILKKIEKAMKNKKLLLKHKDGTVRPSQDELKASRRLIGEKKLILDKPKDLDRMIFFLEERILIYEKKISNHQNKKELRKENDKFELYRGRFYRDLKEEKKEGHQAEENYKEYIQEYNLNLGEQLIFPTEEEFINIIKTLPNWKAAGPDRIFNFFIKNITSLNQIMYKIISRVCLSGSGEADMDRRKESLRLSKAHIPIDCIVSLGMCPWIANFLRMISSKWNLEVRESNKILFTKRVKRGILQGASLSPLLFVLCLEPLSKRLNEIYPKVEVSMDDKNFASNHLLFIDDLKLLPKTEEILKEMILLENQEEYKYLGLIESSKRKTLDGNTEIILKELERRSDLFSLNIPSINNMLVKKDYISQGKHWEEVSLNDDPNSSREKYSICLIHGKNLQEKKPH